MPFDQYERYHMMQEAIAAVACDYIVASERGKTFATFVYLGHPATFASILGATPTHATRTTFDRMTLAYPDYSVFDVRASRVSADGMHCAQ